MAVRREAVRLELEDHFTRPTLQAAAAAKTLENSLDNLDGTAINVDRSITPLSRDVDGLGRSSRNVGSDIDRLSGRLSIMAQVAASVGPGLIPIGAVAVPAITGLASSLGFAAVGMASLVAASQGVGDALEAVNAAALEPTAENLEKARDAMAALGPEAQAFVARFQDLRPVLADIRDSAAAGWFPGLTEALDHFEQTAPYVADLFERIGEVGGGLVAEGASAFAGSGWDDFRDFVAREAPPALDSLGRSVGNVAAGFGELWMAFGPLNRDFTGWVLDASRSFREWSENLAGTEGFEEFVSYIRTNGPKVADLAAAVADALIQIAQAAAPLGGPVLDALTGIARAIAAIADSPIGVPLMAMVTALSAANLAAKALNGTLGALGVSSRVAGSSMATARLGAAGLALALLDIVAAGSETQAALEGVRMEIALGNLEAARDRLAEVHDQIARWEDFRNTSGFGDFFSDAGTVFTNPDDALNWTGSSVFGDGLEGLRNEARLLEHQISELEGAQNGTTGAMNRGAGATDALGEASLRAQLRQARLAETLRATRQAARQTAGSFIDLSTTANRADFSLDTWLGKLEKQARALRNFRINAETAARRGLDQGLIRSLQKLGPEGAIQLEALANATDRQIDRANDAWRRGRQEIRRYTDDVGGVKRQVDNVVGAVIGANPTLKVNTKKAREEAELTERYLNFLGSQVYTPAINVSSNVGAVVGAVTSMLNNIPDETVYIRGVRTGAAIGARSADGGTVPKTGRPYADRHPYLLADGEEITSNRYGQADYFRPLLKAINRWRPGRGLAEGGTAWARSRASERPMSGGGGAATVAVNPTLSLAGAQFVLEVPGMGRLMTRVIDARIDAHDRHAATLEGR